MIEQPTKEQWAELYANPSTNYEWLEPIIKFSNGHRTLEIGAGSGLLSKKLRELGFDAHTNDINPINQPNHHIFDVLGEWDNDTYDTIFSCGLLEHFEDKDIIKILKEAKKHAVQVISLVPNTDCAGYWEWRNSEEQNGTWDYGNERTFRSMEKLYKKAGFNNILEGYCGNDFGDGSYLLFTSGVTFC